MEAGNRKPAGTSVYVTRSGLPVTIGLEWPFHRSASGADFQVLHGTVTLQDGTGVHALVALQLTVTVREILPSLETRDAAGPAINTIRKAIDRKELEFLKTPKRVPVPFNSRMYDFKRNRWAFGESTDEERTALLLRKAYWQTKLGAGRIAMADPVDALYLDTTTARLIELAHGIASRGLVGMHADHAEATAELMAMSDAIEEEMRQTREALEKKHAFERG